MSDLRPHLNRVPKHYGFTPWWLAHFASFDAEVRAVHDTLVVSAKCGPADVPYKYTLWSYISRCFAFVDLFSRFWSLSAKDTRRMAAFLRRYMGLDGLTAHVAVNLWRHPLAHAPFPIGQMTEKVAYTPVPQWRVLPDEHLKIVKYHETDDWAVPGEPVRRYMHLGLLNFLADLDGALTRYVDELDTSPKLQAISDKRWREETDRTFS
jgi:hypothetical protein